MQLNPAMLFHSFWEIPDFPVILMEVRCFSGRVIIYQSLLDLPHDFRICMASTMLIKLLNCMSNQRLFSRPCICLHQTYFRQQIRPIEGFLVTEATIIIEVLHNLVKSSFGLFTDNFIKWRNVLCKQDNSFWIAFELTSCGSRKRKRRYNSCLWSQYFKFM